MKTRIPLLIVFPIFEEEFTCLLSNTIKVTEISKRTDVDGNR